MKKEYIEKQHEVSRKSEESLFLKTVVCAVFAVIMTVLVMLGLDYRILATATLVFSAAIFGLLHREMVDALVSLVKLAPSNDTFNAISLIFISIRAVALFFIGSNQSGFFSPVLFFSIAVSMFMKYLYAGCITKNIAFIKEHDTYHVGLSRSGLSQRYINKVCSVTPSKADVDILSTTYAEDPSEERSRLFVPILSGLIVVFSVIMLILKGLSAFFVSLAALFTVCACFTGEMAFVLPYASVQNRIRRQGSVLLGYHSVRNLQDIDTFMISDNDIFPPELAEIKDVKVRGKAYATKVLGYTAMIAKAIRSPIRHSLFRLLQITEDQIGEPENLRIIRNYGVSASMNSDEILIGNRNLLLSYDIKPLAQEKEASLVSTDNGSILYCTINRQLAAVFLVKYNCGPDLKKAAEKIGDFKLLIETDDCNVTEALIKKQLDIPDIRVIVPGNEETNAVSGLKKEFSGKEPPAMISSEKSIGVLNAVKQVKFLSKILSYSIFAKQLGIILTVLLTAVAIFMSPEGVGGLWLLLINLLWAVPVLFMSAVTPK